MKKKIPYILIALLVISQVYSIGKISDLENLIWTTNNRIGEVENALNNNISSIYTNVDDMLKEQASIIHSASVSFGEFDVDTITVPVNFTVAPKQVTDTMTVSLKFEDETVQLEKDDTTYIGSKIFNISENEINPDIIIEDNGTKTITQDNGLRIYDLCSEFIPRLYPVSPFDSSITTRPNSDIIEYQQTGELFIDGNYEDFEKVSYVTYIDGEKISEINIELSQFSAGEPIFPSDEILKLEKGQIIQTYVVALDNLGFTHQYPLEYYEAGSDEKREPYYDLVRITAENGEIIYDGIGNEKYAEEYGYEVEEVYP